jgi:hypothetical protein
MSTRARLPYTLGTRDYFNGSILDNGFFYGLACASACVAIAIAALRLYGYYRTLAPLFWFAMRCADSRAVVPRTRAVAIDDETRCRI